MQLLKTAFHSDVFPEDISVASKLRLIVRHAARAIVVKGVDILLLFTQRYHDYSLPGDGIDAGEDNLSLAMLTVANHVSFSEEKSYIANVSITDLKTENVKASRTEAE